MKKILLVIITVICLGAFFITDIIKQNNKSAHKERKKENIYFMNNYVSSIHE